MPSNVPARFIIGTPINIPVAAEEVVAANTAIFKKENGLPIFVPAREQEKMADVACNGDARNGTLSGGFVTLNQQDVENIYRLML